MRKKGEREEQKQEEEEGKGKGEGEDEKRDVNHRRKKIIAPGPDVQGSKMSHTMMIHLFCTMFYNAQVPSIYLCIYARCLLSPRATKHPS